MANGEVCLSCFSWDRETYHVLYPVFCRFHPRKKLGLHLRQQQAKFWCKWSHATPGNCFATHIAIHLSSLPSSLEMHWHRKTETWDFGHRSHNQIQNRCNEKGIDSKEKISETSSFLRRISLSPEKMIPSLFHQQAQTLGLSWTKL